MWRCQHESRHVPRSLHLQRAVSSDGTRLAFFAAWLVVVLCPCNPRWQHVLESTLQVAAAQDGGAVLKALRKTKLPRNRRSPAFSRDPSLEARGCTLGLTEDRCSRAAIMTAATRKRLELTQDLCKACRVADPGFHFTSIQVNLNAQYRMHTDGYDAGPSRMFCCGNFSRGRMWLHTWAGERWTAVDVRERWVAFDGREFHLTEEWEGPERYSLVYFTHPAWQSQLLTSSTLRQLEDLGFPWPTEQDTFELQLPCSNERRPVAEQSLPPALAAWERALPHEW
mmetsp:Transcript_123017/g.244848  ORF Transcript_123017/g.244848 Transcript_123017/m.244848 type:complete len:282 (+) Transcript_123017:142-987(+)